MSDGIVRTEPVLTTTAEAYRGTFAPADAPLGDHADLPPAWEGVLFPFAVPLADLRADGTPARDGALPEIDLPRRMYAGETTTFLRPLRLGATVTQTTRLGRMVEKRGSSGRLAFVDIDRTYAIDDETAVHSVWHDVFLEQTDPDAPAKPPRTDPDAAAAADWIETLELDARALFRFSALTFNTHLIHYDRTWAREVERLPDLLVHGPLTRILMMDAARRRLPGRVPASLDVRALAPALVDTPIRLAGRTTGETTVVVALDPADVLLATARIGWSG